MNLILNDEFDTKMMNFILKIMNFILKIMNFMPKMMDNLLKMVESMLRMMHFSAQPRPAPACTFGRRTPPTSTAVRFCHFFHHFCHFFHHFFHHFVPFSITFVTFSITVSITFVTFSIIFSSQVIPHTLTRTTPAMMATRSMCVMWILPPSVRPTLGACVSENDEFCIENEKLCIKNEEFCIKNDEFCRRRRVCELHLTGSERGLLDLRRGRLHELH